MKVLEKESVWDYPRPPRLEKIGNNLKVVFNGMTIAETKKVIVESPPGNVATGCTLGI